jgi:cell wall-associated NlpC family hydrolase
VQAVRRGILLAGLSTIVALSGGGAVASAAPGSTTTTTAPTNAQIGATEQQVAQIEASIAHEQQLSDSLSERYDAAQQQVQTVQAALAVTSNALINTRAHLSLDRSRLRRDAVNAYVYGVTQNSYAAIFTMPSTRSDAAQEYDNTVVGNVAADAASVQHQQSRLEGEQSRQQAQAHQAAVAADQVRTLEQANLQAQAATEATLQQVKGQLAQEVAAAAVAQAQQEAAAAAKAASAAQAQKDAAAAAGAAAVAGAVGGSAAGAQATDAANQAAGSAGSHSGSSGGSGSSGSSGSTGSSGSSGGSSGSGGSSVPIVYTGGVGPNGATNAAGNAAVAAAQSQLGVPYQWGGETPGKGFDCSGLTQWAWAQGGVSIPRTSQVQWSALPHVSLTALEPGDLLFYYNLDSDSSVDHVVMYVGSGPYGAATIIQAPYTGTTVSYSPVFTVGLIGAARP